MKYDIRIDGETYQTYNDLKEAEYKAARLNATLSLIPEAGYATVVGEYDDSH